MKRLIYNVLALVYRIGGRVPTAEAANHASECPWCYTELHVGNPTSKPHLEACHDLYCTVAHTDEVCQHYANALYALDRGI